MITEKDKAYIFATLAKMKKSLEDRGLNVYAIALKGSQNYNLHDSESDIDANAVIIPTLADLRSPQKHKYMFEEGEVTCHDIYAFAGIVEKGNPQWIETCNTEFIIGDLSVFQHLKINPKALGGMVNEKVVAFSKQYPSRKVYVDKFGYDPKQLHHIIRLADLLESGQNTYSYSEEQREKMIKIKRGELPGSLEKAETMRDEYVEKIKVLLEPFKGSRFEENNVDYNVLDKIVMDHLFKYYN